MDSSFLAKLIFMGVFFLEVTIFGNFVSSLACFSNKRTMDMAMTFSGSLFLSIALLDVIPEAITSFDEFFSGETEQLYENSSLHQGKLPLTLIIAVGTFMLTMWLDKILIGHSHDHEYQISFVAGPKKTEDADRPTVEVELEQRQSEDIENDNPPSQRQQMYAVSEKSTTTASWKPYILQVGMSIHAFFETLAVGLQKTSIGVVSLATAILVHKWAEGLTLALLYKKEGFPKQKITLMIVLQGVVNIIGLLAGSFLADQGNFVVAFFMSMSAGTFLYISLAEVLQQQLRSFNCGKAVMMLTANTFILCIVLMEKQQEGGE